MRSRRLLLTVLCGMAFLAAIWCYVRVHGNAPADVLSTRRWDKIWQFAFVVPAVGIAALAISLWLRCELSSVLAGMAGRLSPKRLILLGFILLTLIAYGPLGHVPRSKDEAQYLFQGRLLLSGDLWAPTPPCADAFELRGIVIRDDRWIPAYDPGHSLLIGLADRVGLSWIVGPLLGGLALWLLYSLGQALYGRGTARGALGLALVSPFFLLLAASYSYHVTSLCLTTFILLCMIRKPQNPRYDYALGLGAGLLVLVRPLGLAILFLPLCVLEIHRWVRTKKMPITRIARTALVMLPFVLCYLAYNKAVTGHPLVTGRQFLYPTSLLGFGADSAHGPSYGTVGHTPIKGLLNVLLQFGTLSTGLFGWSLVSLVPSTVGFLARRRSIWEWVFVLLIAATASLLFFSWYSAVEHGPRHYLDAWPGLMLLSAIGLQKGYQWIRYRAGILGTNWMILTVAGFFIMTATLYMPVRLKDVSGPWLGVDPKIRSVVSKQVEPPALVFMSFPKDPADYYCSGFVHNDPYLTSPVLYARDLGALRNAECLTRFPGRRGYLLRYDPVSRSSTILSIDIETIPRGEAHADTEEPSDQTLRITAPREDNGPAR